MKAFIWPIPTVIFAICIQAAETPDFDKLRDSYKAAVARATQPIAVTYVSELEKLRDNYARNSNSEAVEKIQAEIDTIRRDAAIVTPTKPPAPVVAKGKVLEQQVVVPAKDVNGYKIGPLKKGDTITLTYVTGRWKDHGKVPTDNPDAQFTEMGDATRLVIANGRYKTKPGPLLAKVPSGTASKPFSYTLDADQENVVLRINEEGTDYESNPGEVTYLLRVSR